MVCCQYDLFLHCILIYRSLAFHWYQILKLLIPGTSQSPQASDYVQSQPLFVAFQDPRTMFEELEAKMERRHEIRSRGLPLNMYCLSVEIQCFFLIKILSPTDHSSILRKKKKLFYSLFWYHTLNFSLFSVFIQISEFQYSKWLPWETT